MNFKKLSVLALSATFVVAPLVGCSSSSSDETASDDTTSTAETVASTGETQQIGIPSDATNGARALLLLEQAGLIEVDDAAGYTPELKDVTEYIYDIEIVPTQANTLVATLDDFGASTINGTYASPAGLTPSEDGLITEEQDLGDDNPYNNVIVARTEDADNETYKTIVAAYQSQLVAEYILEKNPGMSIPSFEYDPDYEVEENFIDEIEGYQSSSEGKTVVKVGICGSGETWRAVQKQLDDTNSGIYVELVVFDAYNLPNEALDSGEIDLNAFQHKAYLANEVETQGYDIVAIGNTSCAPLTLYSYKYDTLDELKEAAGKLAD